MSISCILSLKFVFYVSTRQEIICPEVTQFRTMYFKGLCFCSCRVLQIVFYINVVAFGHCVAYLKVPVELVLPLQVPCYLARS